ncbi:excinuclease ABC subunit UvrC [Geosporobacter ferrireducens]|uniref:UvrABC system protein C n=1 Tax=Geosporobacter ferrireducens TaxID=1424294 RepID=A0A1D8GLF8_9FIRM|nr:excinuclease ABC subunit UvrC [Geosporobacter ferrireducens]AOT71746.1 excinuclease ABC subunit C [Geosporobacter ferrireducens]MTI55527.1 excinuclease ABC subunit UvrC [Geosporobacter ferrireducens]
MFDINEQLKKLPEKPGVYLMKDESGGIIYVGKAISLKNRVRQYFQSLKNHPAKVRAMVANIVEFEYIITDSEVEALMLESNLIKKHRPKYNILLRDDKHYPYLKVTLGEKYPRVLKTRRVLKDGARYFGPYINVGAVNQTLEILKKFYPLRTCGKNLEKANDRPCLNYHIHRCLGPCKGDVHHEDYMKMIQDVILFLSGKQDELLKELERRMQKAAENMDFERAAEYRDQMKAIESIMEKQKVVVAADVDQDIIASAREGQEVCVMVFFVRGGKLMGREHYMLDCEVEDGQGEILSSFMKQFYGGTAFVPKEILIEEEFEDQQVVEQWLSTIKGSKMLIKHPLRGEKKELLDLARKNAREIFEHFRDKLIKDKEKSVGALEELATLLQLREIPYRIEAFDISNIQGTDSVASMVVFENGKPKNSDYRRFKIKTVEGANDYGSMQEVVYRRFRKGLEEQAMIKEKGIADLEGKFSKMPKLILIDGGLGHLNAIRDVLNALGVDIPLAGMVKDDRHRTRGLIYQGEEIELNQYPNAFQLVGRVQEEAHRFAITYHKSLRGKTSVQSVLDEIPGIGEKRRVALLRHFGSIDKIKKASLEELGAVEGMNRGAALQVQQFLLNRKG